MPSSDAELVARVVADDDHDAFGELVARHQSRVRAWLRRLTGGDFALADDLAQESFVIAYRQLKTLRDEARFSTWLFTIAHRRFASEARRRKQFTGLDEAPLETLADPVEPNPGDDRREDLTRGLAALSLEQRAAITLCYQQGLTHEEAAVIMNCPLGTVKTHILRGKERLLRYLNRVEAATR